MKTLKQIREASGGKEAYQKFFNSLLKKFGVDSPSELDGKKKKDFFNAVDKGWEGDDPNDANEATIHLSNELTEKLRGGRGKATLDIDFEGDKKDAKFMATKYKIKIKLTRMGADISGDKQKILAFLQGKDYGMDDADIEDLFPELMENKDDFKDDTDVSDDKGNYSGVEEAHNGHTDDESPKKKVGDDEGNYSGVEEDIYGRAEYYKRVDKVNAKWGIGPAAKTLSDLSSSDVKKYFKDYDKAVKEMNEKAPPGMESKVKELKKDHSDEEAFAIAWSIHNKKNEAVKKEGFFGKSYPVMDQGQRTKIIKIAKKNSGNMQKAIKLIDKIRKGLSDNPAVIDILKKANESVYEAKMTVDVDYDDNEVNKRKHMQLMKKHKVKVTKSVWDHGTYRAKVTGDEKNIRAWMKGQYDQDYIDDTFESVQEGVDVDRRTLGFKAAIIRNEKAKKVREKSKLKKEKKKEQEVLDARYDYDGGVDVVLATANKALFGETGANAVAHGGVDMAPNAGKKEKKSKVIKRYNY